MLRGSKYFVGKFIPLKLHAGVYMPDHSGWISGNNSVRLYIVRYNAAGPDHRILTDSNTRKNGRAGSDPRPLADMYRLAGNYRPISKS